MATVTAATAGRTEQHSAVTDRGLTDFPLGRFNDLLLVNQAVTAVRTHCETLKSTALSQEQLPYLAA